MPKGFVYIPKFKRHELLYCKDYGLGDDHEGRSSRKCRVWRYAGKLDDGIGQNNGKKYNFVGEVEWWDAPPGSARPLTDSGWVEIQGSIIYVKVLRRASERSANRANKEDGGLGADTYTKVPAFFP